METHERAAQAEAALAPVSDSELHEVDGGGHCGQADPVRALGCEIGYHFKALWDEIW